MVKRCRQDFNMHLQSFSAVIDMRARNGYPKISTLSKVLEASLISSMARGYFFPLKFSIGNSKFVGDPLQLEMTSSSLNNFQARDRSIGVHHGSLPVFEYELGFLKWASNFLILYPSEQVMVYRVIRGLHCHFIWCQNS